MVFNSLSFLLFFIVVFGIHHWLPMPWRARKLFLLAASYLFYAVWNPPFVALLWTSTIVDFYLARWLHRLENETARRWLVIGSLALNLGLLGFFKYGGFMAQNWNLLSSWLGLDTPISSLNLILPLGISFYTFETISYIIDVYRRQLEPADSLLDYALFIAFFPHLVAGPIVRARDFLPQCRTRRRATRAQAGWGFVLMVVGLFQKMIIADWIMAPAADAVFNASATASLAEAWVGALAFSAQIFCDFAGYSACGIGAALCLGFVLNDNFRCPYAAAGFSDFWRRWHMSLSSWLRDYLYIPLGGNRGGSAATARNLFATVLLGGLWHGASWHFVIWGALHGVFLIVERGLKEVGAGWAWVETRFVQAVLMLATFGAISFAWIFFRAPDVVHAGILMKTMLLGGAGKGIGLAPGTMLSVTAVALLLVTAHACLRDLTLEGLAGRLPWWLRALVLVVLLLALFFAPGDERAFIYFQF